MTVGELIVKLQELPADLHDQPVVVHGAGPAVDVVIQDVDAYRVWYGKGSPPKLPREEWEIWIHGEHEPG